MQDAYREDLAHIHDVGFGEFARKAATGLLRILRQRGIEKGLVVDLGCGSGIWARELCDAGYEVLGVDISAGMIRIARRRVPRADFIHASFLSVDLPACEAVTSLGECFNYLFDRENGIVGLRRIFHRVFAALKPGGLFVFDIAEPGRVAEPRQRHYEGKDWAVFVAVEEDEDDHRLTRRITTFRKVGRLYRRDHETHRQQLYKRSAISLELRRAGFRVQILRGFDRLQFPAAHAGFLATKPKSGNFSHWGELNNTVRQLVPR